MPIGRANRATRRRSVYARKSAGLKGQRRPTVVVAKKRNPSEAQLEESNRRRVMGFYSRAPLPESTEVIAGSARHGALNRS